MLSNPFQLRLSQKGLALVCALLAMELLFVGWLFGLLQESERYAAELSRSKTIISNKDQLLQLLSEVNNAFNYRSIKEALGSKEYDTAIAQFPVVVGNLEVLFKDEPQRLEVLHDANSLIKNQIEIIDKVKERLIAVEESGGASVSMEEIAKMHRIKRRMEHTRDAIVRLLFDLDAPERKLEEQIPGLEAKSRQSLRQSLLLGAIFNVIIAIALGLAFVRNITHRVEVLVDNTNRVSKNQTLNPPLGGTDEIAHLDRTFHSMAAALHEAELRDLEIQKLKEEFIAMASHELRSPLTSIQGALTMLNAGVFGELPEVAAERIERAESNVARLISLINDLLDAEKMKAGKLDVVFEQTDVADVITKSVMAVREFAEGRQVEIVGVEPDAVIEADKTRLIQVMVNLLSNAIKHSPKGGRVEIVVDEDDEHSVSIAVRDQGPGVPAQFAAAIFDKFEQLPADQETNKRQGTGLGLTIAKQIVLRHGGTIGVDSEEGKGSSFWMRLPRKQNAGSPSLVTVTESETTLV